jgi:tetratricopeptide (TPR) repeat protein
MEAYSRDLQEVVRLAESLDDPCTLAHLRWRQAYAHRWFCRYADAQQAAEEGLRLLRYSKRCTALSLCQDEGFAGDRRAGRCPFEAFCWREIGMAAREMGDNTGAETALTGALDRFSVLGATGYKIHTLGNLSTLYWRQGQFERAREMALQELDCCEEAQLELERRLPLGDLGAAAAALGEADRAEEALSESLALARRIDDRTQEIFCLGHLGWLGIGQMQPAQALVHLGAALALAGRINSCAERSWLLSGLAEAHRLAGDEKAARASAQAALETAMATNRRHDQEVARRILDSLAAS